MDKEFNGILHIRTAVIVSDRFCSEKTVWIYNLLIIKSKKDSSQNVHLFHNHLYIKKTED